LPGDDGYRPIVSLTFYIGEYDIVERRQRDADHAFGGVDLGSTTCRSVTSSLPVGDVGAIVPGRPAGVASSARQR